MRGTEGKDYAVPSKAPAPVNLDVAGRATA